MKPSYTSCIRMVWIT